MAHLTGIAASAFSDLSIGTDNTLNTVIINNVNTGTAPTAAALGACFASTKYSRVTNIREFPSIGAPANIINVPQYGQKISSQVQGQADAPTLELTINYVPDSWKSGSTLGNLIGDGTQRVFRFTLLNELPLGYDWLATRPASAGTCIGGNDANPVENSSWYFVGRVEALLINPQLTDATTATLTLSTQSDFFGAYSV